MKSYVSILFLLLSIFIFQGCCSLNLPVVGDLTCAGKGAKVSLDRFIIRLKPLNGGTVLNEGQIMTLLENAFPQNGPITLKRCECGDPDLLMVILGESLKTRGELLTSVKGLRGGSMNTDPLLRYKRKKSDLNNIPSLTPAGPSNPNVQNFFSNETDAMVLVILDSGINLNRFTGEQFLFQNPAGIDCLETSGPSSGYNFVDNNTNIQDNAKRSHGTFVTKKITEGLKGTNTRYQILPLKISNGRFVSSWDLLCAISFAKQMQDKPEVDIRIINASLGFRLSRSKLDLLDGFGIQNPTDAEQMTILKSYIEDFSDSALIVTSAGNDGENVDNNLKHAYYPPGFDSDNLMAVGGLRAGIIGKHPKSNYGPVSIDIAAPYTHPLLSEQVSGTSISTAQVSASLAKLWHENLALTPSQLKALFLQEAEDSPGLSNYIKNGKYEQ